jgi:DNA-binding Lrp family transcriptional regulator
MSKTAAGHGGMSENPTGHRQNGGLRDALDEKLVALLARDARMTLTALARELALSRTAVQARMARLERDRVILGYRAVVADRDDETLQAVLTLTFSQRPCLPVVRTFRHWPEIRQYYSVTGPNDGYVMVRVADAHALSALVDRLSAVPGVAAVQSAVVLRTELD